MTTTSSPTSLHALLLVPGLMCDAAVWTPLLPPLAAYADCHIVDHGMADSLGTMADQLLASAPPTFAMAGHSMGGRVALEVMRRAPERVTRLALLDTGYKAKAAVRIPTLVACGQQDSWSPPSQHEEIASYIPARPTVHTIAQAGHMATMERPAASAQLLIDWLSQASSPTSA